MREGRARADKETHAVSARGELGRLRSLGLVSVQELQGATVDHQARGRDLKVSESHTGQSDHGHCDPSCRVAITHFCSGQTLEVPGLNSLLFISADMCSSPTPPECQRLEKPLHSL